MPFAFNYFSTWEQNTSKKIKLTFQANFSFGHLGNCTRPRIARKSVNFSLIVLNYSYIII